MNSRSGPRFPLVQLAPEHNVVGFTCGNRPGAAEIDEYLTINALAEQTAGLSQVWIATDPEGSSAHRTIAGYFTLSPLSIRLTPAVLAMLGLGSVPYQAVGGYLLGRLGVAAHLQGQDLGATLIAAAIKIARQVRADVGGVFLAVDPKNEKLLTWYENLDFGFRRLDPSKRRIVLKL